MRLKSPALLLFAAWMGTQAASAQIFVDCSCLATQSVLITNACQGVVPDMCQFTNCFQSSQIPPPTYSCSQTPAAGTLVGPGPTPITVTVSVPGQAPQNCNVMFRVNPPTSGCGFSLTCASNKTVECGTTWSFDPPTPVNPCPDATGQPGPVTIIVLNTVTNGNCPKTITQTWQATDACGSVATCQQTVTVNDTKPPVITCGTNKTAECGTTWTFDQPTATDSCGSVTVTITGTVTNLAGFCGNTFAVTRTWKATDACGNTANCSQTVTVVDTTPPTITCVANKFVECGTAWNFDQPTASDTCGNVTVSIVITVTNTTGFCGNTFAATRTWKATDACGNTNSCSQTVTVRDTTPPTILCLGNKIAECGTAWNFDPPTASDTCGSATISIVGTVTNIAGFCGNTFAATRTFRATDACGNTSTCTQMVTVVDTTAPTITCVANKSVECTTAWTFNAPTASDTCGTNSITIVGTVTNTAGFCGNTFAATRTWRATDACGNTSTCTQMVTVVDTTAPTITCATNKTVACGATWTFDQPTASDTCGSVTISITGTTTNLTGSCGGLVAIRTWRATDACGNSLTCSQTVTVSGGALTLDCNSLTNLSVLRSNACTALIPSLCPYVLPLVQQNCPCPLSCTQNPAPGTPVGTGPHPITVTITNTSGGSASCVLTFVVNGGSQSNIWNTGMGGVSGNVALGAGTPDPNYTLVSQPPGGCTGPAQVLAPATLPVPPWLANGPNSQWIGGGPGANCQGGVYHYRLCFYLPCTDGAVIRGQWTADDWATMQLNGVPTGNTVPSTQFPNNSFNHWHPVNITNGFVCGDNCLDFYVTNAYTFDNPTGLRAELTNVFNDCCCQPAQTLFSVFSGEAAGGPLPQGAQDPQLSLTCAPPGVTVTTPLVVNPHPVWLTNGPTSQWIGPDVANQGPPGGVYCYTLNFNIPCPAGSVIRASLTGQWAADDTGAIYLNGLPTGNILPNGWAFTNWHAINITSGFVSGLNTLTFYVTNGSSSATGLRLELTGTSSCCSCTPQPCSCNFTNGDFSQSVPVNGSGGGWTSSGLLAGFSGWQSTGGNPGGTFLLNNVGDPATDPTISQTLCCLTPGHCYTIRGQRKVQAWFGQTAPSFAVLVDGAPILTLPVPTIPADTNWHDFSVSFTATNTCQTIGFAAEFNGTDVSYWIDNIRVECCNPNCTVSITCPPNQVLLACFNNSAVGYYKVTASGNNGPIVCTPPSGTTFPLGTNVVICTATNNCGAVANCYFTIIVKPPPNRWACRQLGIGIPFDLVGGATMALRPGIGIGDPAICLFPNPAIPASGALLQPGAAQAITFTTLLDFTADVGAGIDLVLPPGPNNSNSIPLLSFRSKGPKGYCVKSAKRFADDPSGTYRAIVVNTNGQLLDSLTFSSAEIQANGIFDILFQPGVSNCHVTVQLNCLDGSMSIEFAGPVTLSSARKGWDGCIYGPDRPVKKPTSRVIITPPPSPGAPPITDLYLYSSGYAEVLMEEPSITASGRKWGDGHVTLMKAYDDGESMEFAAMGDGGGVHVDLGQTESFNLRLTKFATNLPAGEDLLTRTIGPIRGLTNRPPPPVLDALLLHGVSGGVECSADFSPIDSPTVTVLIYNQGVFVTQRAGISAQLGQALVVLDSWPLSLGKLGGRTPCRRITIKSGTIRFPGGGLAGAGPDTFAGDEVRILAELSDDAPRPDYYSGFEFEASEGADWGISNVQRTLACSSVPLSITHATPGGLTATWSGEGLRLQGAEKPTGPWYELGAASPAAVPPSSPARFFRLVCD